MLQFVVDHVILWQIATVLMEEEGTYQEHQNPNNTWIKRKPTILNTFVHRCISILCTRNVCANMLQNQGMKRMKRSCLDMCRMRISCLTQIIKYITVVCFFFDFVLFLLLCPFTKSGVLRVFDSAPSLFTLHLLSDVKGNTSLS